MKLGTNLMVFKDTLTSPPPTISSNNMADETMRETGAKLAPFILVSLNDAL